MAPEVPHLPVAVDEGGRRLRQPVGERRGVVEQFEYAGRDPRCDQGEALPPLDDERGHHRGAAAVELVLRAARVELEEPLTAR